MALWNRFRFRSPHAFRLIHWIFEFRPSLGIGHTSWVPAQRPSMGVMLNPQGSP